MYLFNNIKLCIINFEKKSWNIYNIRLKLDVKITNKQNTKVNSLAHSNLHTYIDR